MEEPISCNEASANIMTNLYCDVPMATLLAAPFSLTYNSLIQARV